MTVSGRGGEDRGEEEGRADREARSQLGQRRAFFRLWRRLKNWSSTGPHAIAAAPVWLAHRTRSEPLRCKPHPLLTGKQQTGKQPVNGKQPTGKLREIGRRRDGGKQAEGDRTGRDR